MADQIRLSPDQIDTIATSIENLNKRLEQELQTGLTTVQNLSSTWEGQAAEETIQSFKTFSDKYFNEYYVMLNNYVLFLRNNVRAGYLQAEQANVNWANAFK